MLADTLYIVIGINLDKVPYFFTAVFAGAFSPEAIFGVACVWSGAELDNIWIISDLTNIMMVYINVPLIIIGFKYSKMASKAYLSKGMVQVVDKMGLDIDAASARELHTILSTKINPKKVHMHGNNKSSEELDLKLKELLTFVKD